MQQGICHTLTKLFPGLLLVTHKRRIDWFPFQIARNKSSFNLIGLIQQQPETKGEPSAIWQLSSTELRDTTLTSFVKFIAQRYKAAPLKTGLKAIKVPDFEKCSKCDANMKVRHRVDNQFDIRIRILWECVGCDHTEWKRYEDGKRQVGKGYSP